jgi:LmbE family N-acetylglucosaminyl deacetylase
MNPVSILAIAPHPDDETLGCGGTLLRMKKRGAKIHWVIGTQMRAPAFSQDQISERAEMIRSVAQAYGFDSVDQLTFPAAELDIQPLGQIVKELGDIVARIQPEIVFIPNRSDIHTDHYAMFCASLSVTKWFRYPSVRSVFMYEVLSETDFSPALPEAAFVPNVFYDISGFLERKMKVMRLYHTEMSVHPFPRNEEAIRAQALLRGVQAGCRYAEGFVLIKEIR